VRFLVLGPVEASGEDGPLPLGGRKQRLVLAHLIVRANQVVPTDVLIDEVWDEEPPDSARSTLQGYVSHLRRAIGSDRLEGRASAYVLHASPGEVDAQEFEDLVAEGRSSVDADPEEAAARLAEALAIWRGPAFADLADERSLQGEIARLSELRLLAAEDRISAGLALGRHAVLVGELESLTLANPLRERLWGLRILALYRSGRQADALAAYRIARGVLEEQLGIDPSRALQRLNERILAQDPALSLASRTPAAGPSPTGDLAPGTPIAGYRIRSVLGRGGMGVVYLAEHEGLQRNVALKVLAPQFATDPKFRERFVRESQLAANLEHPHVIPIYEAGEGDGVLFIAMRYVEGVDLRKLLLEGPLKPDRALAILRQVADALDAAHERRLVHRDVKPGNILLAHRGPEPREEAYLSDFGLTKRTSSLPGLSGTGEFVGTLDYAAPEQFEGKPLDARTDVYSLGAVLFECLTGRAPFPRPNEAAVMYAHMMEPPPAVTAERPELPGRIDEVVRRAMAKEPADRHPTAGAVIAEATDALGPSAGPLREPKPPAPGRLRRVSALVAAIVALAIVAVALPRLLGGGEPEAATFRPGIALIDPQTLEPVAQLPVEEPVEGHFTDGSFWFLNLEPLSFVQIDADERRIVREINSPLDDVSSFAVVGDSLWVSHGSHPILVRVDIRTEREADRYTFTEKGTEDVGLVGPVVGDGSVWIARGGEVLRIEPASGEIRDTIRVEAAPGGHMSFSQGKVWVPGEDYLHWIDPATDEVTSSVPLFEATLEFPLGAGGFGWVASSDRNRVFQYHANGGLIRGHVTGQGPGSIAYGAGRIWVANHDSGTIGAIDVGTGRTTSFALGHPARGIAFGAGLVAATVGRGESVTDRLAALEGSALVLAATEPYNESVDPALADDPGMWQVERATCAKLLNYPDAPAPEGWELRPEVATAMPEVSSDGRMYTFRIRSGFAFSPPSNEAVTAETFRFSIERALSRGLGASAPGYRFLPDIVGLDAFRAGETEHIAGLSAAGDTLAITLVEPSGDFLPRLAMPFFCPVPTDTPTLEGGVGANPVPAAGPYFVSENEESELLILQRNPNYSGDRPSVFDAIAIRFKVDFFAADDPLEDRPREEWDGVVGFSIGLLGAAISGYEGYDTRPLGTIEFVALNATGNAFSDPDVRAAAALAIDRFDYTQFDRLPTDAFLPPDLPGADPEVDATLPDPERAKRTLDGRVVDVTIATAPGSSPAPGRLQAQRREPPKARDLGNDLDEAGFRVEIETVSSSAFLSDPDRFDLALRSVEIPYPDTATFVSNAILGGAVPVSWFPDDVVREAMRVEGLTGDVRTTAAAALADRLVDEHLVVPLGMLPRSSYVSDRVGCLVYPPFGWGFDLVTICPSR
jgi:serine/threonine protein kinase/ABC-type oligopeptide transport system substrate-binding subunit